MTPTDTMHLRRFHPSVPAISFVIWWIVAAIVFPDRMLNADGDMLRHISHGSWMLENGRLITADPFSFTKGGEPFVAFEYGSQLLYAAAYKVAGLSGVAILAAALIATAYSLLAHLLLRRGVDALLAYLATVVAAVLGAVHWVPRPHLITLVAVVLLLHVLERQNEDGSSMRPSVPALARVALLFAVWANLHGGFIFGLVLLGAYFAGSLLELLFGSAGNRPLWRARASWYAAAGAAGGLASLLTPHGIRLHQHIFALFGDTYLLDNTQEFLSPDFHTIVGKVFLSGLLLAVAALAMAPARADFRRLLVILVMISFALNARRNIQLFGVAVFPLIALHVDPFWRQLRDWRGIRAVFNRDSATGRTLPYVAGILLIALILAAGRGELASVRVVPDAVSEQKFPVSVVAQARANGDTGRLFHDFIWGGYLLNAWPEQKVFIDGGTDFYGDELMYTYINTTELGRGWQDSLARWDISRVLLPTGSGLLLELATRQGWSISYCDATATMLERPIGDSAATPTTVDELRACRGASGPQAAERVR